jgi:hypothetical protein
MPFENMGVRLYNQQDGKKPRKEGKVCEAI